MSDKEIDINDQNTIEKLVDHHPDEITKEHQKIVQDILETFRLSPAFNNTVVNSPDMLWCLVAIYYPSS